ncbi:MAG: hypothetical protein R3F33_08340 [Planctomycetota bacterium]
MKSTLTLLALLATASTAAAQSTVYGINLRSAPDQLFVSDTANFVTNWAPIATTASQPFYGLDFNADATTLYAIDYATSEFGTIDLGTGAFTVLGVSTLPLSSIRGLTAHPNGTTWYAMVGVNAGADSALWVGDMTTGTFTQVGVTVTASLMIDIACDVNGNLYGLNISDDALYSIDSTTGAGTFIGAHGLAANFAQGMDFDWSTNTLYAPIYTGGGTGQFCSLDVTTGAILTSEDTVSLNAEMEIAIQQPAPGSVGTPFCDPADNNSTGGPVTMTGSTTAAGSGLHLEATGGPVNEFGYFLIGTAPETVNPIAISDGHLCLSVTGGNSFGRYNVTGGALNSIGGFNASGTLANFVGTSTTGTGFDVPSTVPLAGSPTIMAGDTWHFQLWYRDTPAGAGHSNLSNGLSYTF